MLLGAFGVGVMELVILLFMVLGCMAPVLGAIVVASYYVFKSGQRRKD